VLFLHYEIYAHRVVERLQSPKEELFANKAMTLQRLLRLKEPLLEHPT
jgi:hypothetical protein